MLQKKTLISSIRRRDDDQKPTSAHGEPSAFTEWLPPQENAPLQEAESDPAQGSDSLATPMLKTEGLS